MRTARREKRRGIKPWGGKTFPRSLASHDGGMDVLELLRWAETAGWLHQKRPGAWAKCGETIGNVIHSFSHWNGGK